MSCSQVERMGALGAAAPAADPLRASKSLMRSLPGNSALHSASRGGLSDYNETMSGDELADLSLNGTSHLLLPDASLSIGQPLAEWKAFSKDRHAPFTSSTAMSSTALSLGGTSTFLVLDPDAMPSESLKAGRDVAAAATAAALEAATNTYCQEVSAKAKNTSSLACAASDQPLVLPAVDDFYDEDDDDVEATSQTSPRDDQHGDSRSSRPGRLSASDVLGSLNNTLASDLGSSTGSSGSLGYSMTAGGASASSNLRGLLREYRVDSGGGEYAANNLEASLDFSLTGTLASNFGGSRGSGGWADTIRLGPHQPEDALEGSCATLPPDLGDLCSSFGSSAGRDVLERDLRNALAGGGGEVSTEVVAAPAPAPKRLVTHEGNAQSAGSSKVVGIQHQQLEAFAHAVRNAKGLEGQLQGELLGLLQQLPISPGETLPVAR